MSTGIRLVGRGRGWRRRLSGWTCRLIRRSRLRNGGGLLVERPGDFLHQASSDDYGRTWTVPKQTEIWGFPPHMLKLGDGRIVCLVGHRRAPYSIRGVVSADNGKTWDTDNTFTVHQWEDEPDMGYPVSLEVAPNEILTVFYCSRRDAKEWGHVKQDGDTPEGILSVRYRLC